MAKNTGNNRIPVKWVRDKAKSAYDKKDHCYICGTDQDLELHHFNSITILLERWATAKSYDISTDDGILSVQVPFDVPVTVVPPQVAVTVEPVVTVTVMVGRSAPRIFFMFNQVVLR